ncbi:hypothetical protein ACFTZJ_31370 [Streptomyces globisporus]|uniref:hypothetical protein n=1 Tax=Streptomyces globisporus TaxID=1908 RepID=UPI00363F26AE
MVSRVNEALPARDAALLVSSHPGPLLAHRMHTMAEAGEPLTTHLARLTPDTAARHTGPPADPATRLPLAAHYALTTPLDTPLPTGPRVSAPAARSTTTRPDTTAHTQRPPPPNLPRPHTTARPPPHHAKGADGRTTGAFQNSGTPPAAGPHPGSHPHTRTMHGLTRRQKRHQRQARFRTAARPLPIPAPTRPAAGAARR